MSRVVSGAYALPPLDLRDGRVELSHGSGGRAMSQLIEQLFLPAFDNPWLQALNDQAVCPPTTGRLAYTTDGYVVSPLFFPGGDIGSLAVHGTINDLAMAGARPLYLSAGFILEEGLALAELARIVASMGQAARAAQVAIVTGDTKVVERGKGDGVFITTSGVGVVAPSVEVSATRARPGDHILVSGALGDHGVAILSQREHLSFDTALRSDSAALHELVAHMLAAVPDIHCLRDPTRGGLAAALNEIAQQSRVGMVIREPEVPVHGEVMAACEMLGLDPLNIANEGKLVAICAAEDSRQLLATMRAHDLGREAAVIGEVQADSLCLVECETAFGGRRLIDWLSGEPLPRIC